MARGLNAFFPEHEIIHIRDKYDTGSLSDEEWIKALGLEKNWSVLTADINIAKKKPSRNVFLSNNLIGFFLAPSMQKQSFSKQVSRILYLWETIEKQSKLVDRGCFEIPTKSNRLRQIS